MLSRVADSLYWMSRYFERADNASRVLKATYSLISNPDSRSLETWLEVTPQCAQRWFCLHTTVLLITPIFYLTLIGLSSMITLWNDSRGRST